MRCSRGASSGSLMRWPPLIWKSLQDPLSVCSTEQLKEKLPKEDKKAVMLYYILVKDAMTAGNGMSFEEAVGKVSKKQRILKLTPVMLEKVREVMEDIQ